MRINKEKCILCKQCIDTCINDAIVLDLEDMDYIESLKINDRCVNCGVCLNCPKGAIEVER